MTEIYVSTDVEADGPIPGPHSMLSFASAAYRPDKTLAGTFSANLDTLPGAAPHPATAAWWDKHRDAYARTRENLEAPAAAMTRYVAWVLGLPGKPVFVGYPVAFDFMFVTWYLVSFTGRSPFGHAGLDLKTLAMALLGGDFRDAVKKKMPARWFDDLPHTHVALDDALEQGAMAVNMLAELRRPQ